MLEEDFPGCEFSLGSFFVAENEGVVVSALSAWIECSDGLSSANVKSNLFALYLPAHAKVALSSNGRVAQSAALPRMPGALQFEYVFTREKFRGNGIVGELMRFALETFRGDCDVAPRPGVAQIQLLAENVPARRAYEKFGFRIVASRRLVPGQKFYPGAEKLLLEKTL